MIHLQRKYRVDDWAMPIADRCVGYLQGRGFRNAGILPVEGAPVVVGSRGSWLGNLTSFDMTKLRAKIRVASEPDGRLGVDLEISTFAQQVTPWNHAFWRLELVELGRVLLGRERLDDVWRRYAPARRAAVVRWLATMMADRQRLPPAWETELHRLENS
jgi:hypothetical protein